jgi:hypothetical protein
MFQTPKLSVAAIGRQLVQQLISCSVMPIVIPDINLAQNKLSPFLYALFHSGAYRNLTPD